jgi:hypothetical protein
MATIQIVGDALVVMLSTAEKLGALHGDITVPRSGVRRVRPVASPLHAVRGVRSPGTGFPGLIALGTYRTLSSRDFVAAYRTPGVVVELAGQPYDRLVVSTPDVDRLMALLAD